MTTNAGIYQCQRDIRPRKRRRVLLPRLSASKTKPEEEQSHQLQRRQITSARTYL